MSNNIFVIERNGQSWDGLILDEQGIPVFTEFLDMTYDEMKSNEQLENFVVTVMNATNNISQSDDEQTIINLVNEDGVLIWGILIGPGENEDIRYALVNWKKDDKIYRYENRS